MLTPYDDLLVHQTPEPVAHPATGDPNVYDRYFFNGYTPDGELFFAAALGLYPNRQVMDAAFSVVRRGQQHSVIASRRAPLDRSEVRVGPVTVEVLEPLHRLRVVVDAPEHGLGADLMFTSRTAPLEEPRYTRHAGTRLTMDYTRLTQFGTWDGVVEVDGEQGELSAVLGSRDRSWGIRPVGERGGGAPGSPSQFFWLWSPLHFDDVCVQFDVNEEADGRQWHSYGAVAPVGGAEPEVMTAVTHRVEWEPGTRRARHAELALIPHGGDPRTISLEPVLTFQMLGLGYLHPEWGHGMWKGEEAVHADRWNLADVQPLDPRWLHVQQLCRADFEGRQGIGVFEQLVIGPHAPSGFTELLDGAR